MTEAVSVRHVRFPGDWGILYVDGEKAVSGHTVDAGNVLSELEGRNIAETSSEYRDVNLNGRDPSRYEDIPEE
jgi:hypothetical protein